MERMMNVCQGCQLKEHDNYLDVVFLIAMSMQGNKWIQEFKIFQSIMSWSIVLRGKMQTNNSKEKGAQKGKHLEDVIIRYKPQVSLCHVVYTIFI